MRFGHVFSSLLAAAVAANPVPTIQTPLDHDGANSTISRKLFMELEELARIVDISYCVGVTGAGIQKPFQCLSRCSEFPSFELVETFNTGPLLSDSCGYIAVSHPPAPRRVIMAFRGTYSISNTIADLSTVPQEYVPYPGDDDDKSDDGTAFKHFYNRYQASDDETPPAAPAKCEKCMVHSGFYTSWLNTRRAILPALTEALRRHPDYALTLVGHSLGGAVAALASLDLKARGWDPHVTTFGEPRIGNEAMNHYLDAYFGLPSNGSVLLNSKYRRVTHAGDPVPLLPLEEWNYHMHAGELFITKPELQPTPDDIRYCIGDEDKHCIAGSDDLETEEWALRPSSQPLLELKELLDSHSILARDATPADDQWVGSDHLTDSGLRSPRYRFWPIPSRYKLWQLFFAHRDYFWRLGLCVPGGDPRDWYRKYPHYDDGDERAEL